MDTIDNDRILKLNEVMQLTRFSDQTVRQMAKKGKIPGAFKLGCRWRFNEKELLGWINTQKEAQQ